MTSDGLICRLHPLDTDSQDTHARGAKLTELTAGRLLIIRVFLAELSQASFCILMTLVQSSHLFFFFSCSVTVCSTLGLVECMWSTYAKQSLTLRTTFDDRPVQLMLLNVLFLTVQRGYRHVSQSVFTETDATCATSSVNFEVPPVCCINLIISLFPQNTCMFSFLWSVLFKIQISPFSPLLQHFTMLLWHWKWLGSLVSPWPLASCTSSLLRFIPLYSGTSAWECAHLLHALAVSQPRMSSI